MKPLLAGVGLTVVMAGLAAFVWGPGAAPAAGMSGAMATLIQVAAHRLMARSTNPRSPFPTGWLWGTAFRLGGVVAIVVAVVANRQLFPPLATALGYLGVLIPLLVLELRATR
jgi:hypothetical protein